MNESMSDELSLSSIALGHKLGKLQLLHFESQLAIGVPVMEGRNQSEFVHGRETCKGCGGS